MIQTIFGSPVVILNCDNIQELFPKRLYEEIVEHLMEPENKFVNHNYTRGGKVCTTDVNFTLNKDKINKMSTLLDFLKQTGLKYTHLFTVNSVKDLEFYNMWINLSFEGCEIKNHYDKYNDTTTKSLIVLFYPKAPEGGADLVFIHNSEYGEWASNRSEEDLVRIKVEEGTIVIFDNCILHAVDKHNVVEPRMCIATEFNFV